MKSIICLTMMLMTFSSVKATQPAYLCPMKISSNVYLLYGNVGVIIDDQSVVLIDSWLGFYEVGSNLKLIEQIKKLTDLPISYVINTHSHGDHSGGNGLEWYFHDYPDLSFYSVDDILEFGGVEAVKTYYTKRSERYDVSPEVGAQAKFSIFRHVAQADNYQLFTKFEQILGTYEISAWYQFFGQFF